MATTFPLLMLPLLVLKEIFKSMDLWSLVNLSVCSLKTRHAIKGFPTNVYVGARPNTFTISQNAATFSMNIEDESETEPSTEIVRMNRMAVRITRKQNEHWIIKNSVILDGWKLVMDHLLNTFQVDVNLEIVQERHLFEYLIEHPTKSRIEELNVTSDFINDVDMKFYLENLNTGELCFSSNQNKTFRFNGQFGRFKVFTCSPAEWITRENFLSLDCEFIDLERTSLTNEDINMFLKKWVEGKSPELSEMRVEIERIDLIKIMDGIEILKEASSGKENNASFHVASELYILNKDGLKGPFATAANTFMFEVSSDNEDDN